MRVAMMYLVVQLLSFLILRAAGSYSVRDTWIHGALGPFAAVEAIPRFRYHSLLSNLRFVGGCLIILALPFVYVIRPNRATLILTALGLIVWCLFGFGFTIHHL